MGICQGGEIRRVSSDDDREHLFRSLAHDLIEHRTTRLAGLGLVVDYLEHGRTFPTGAPTPAHDQTCYGLSIFLGKVRPFTSPRRGPSTGSDHCSRLKRLPEGFGQGDSLDNNALQLLENWRLTVGPVMFLITDALDGNEPTALQPCQFAFDRACP